MDQVVSAKSGEKVVSDVAWIECEFLVRKERNSQYSLRAFARDIGISPGHLSRIINGSRPITYRQAARISTALGLTQMETKRIVESTILASGANAKVSDSLRKKIRIQQKQSRLSEAVKMAHHSVERFKAISQWYHLAILELTYTKDFSIEPKWISARLGISELEAKSAVRRLLELGFLETTESGGARKVDSRLFFDTGRSEPEIRIYEKTMIHKALRELDRSDSKSFHARLINSITFPSSEKALPALKTLILEFQRSVFRLIKEHEFEDVYQLNCQLFAVSKKPSGEPK